MTVISEPVADIAGADGSTQFVFSSPVVRESDDGTGLITMRPIFLFAEDGVLTTPELDPGACKVIVGQKAYNITIPDSPTPVRLMPLILASLPVPEEEVATAVINGGGIAIAKRITQSEYEALTTPDPETFYVVVEG